MNAFLQVSSVLWSKETGIQAIQQHKMWRLAIVAIAVVLATDASISVLSGMSSVVDAPTTTDGNTTKTNIDSDELSFALGNLVQGIDNPCGGFKCFYRLKHSYQNKPVGYVAGCQSVMEKTLWEAYDFALQLEQKYGLQHTALKPPETVDLGQLWRLQKKYRDLIAFLDADATLTFGRCPNLYHNLYIQLVENVLLPTDPGLFWGVTEYKQREAEESVVQFIEYLQQQNAAARQEFVSNLRRNADRLRTVLRENFCLNHDFQVVIRHTGAIVHFDLDRCFTKAGKHHPYEYKYEIHPANFTDEVQHEIGLLIERLSTAVLP